ncbi:MAG TPA: DUF624 domain-containing protein [Firmicutes bacterium]|nr:DUF624 domain-containing protein [Bacillota bacterium]
MGFAQSWQVFIEALKTSYHNLGRVMLTNFLWFGVSFAPILAVTYIPFENVWFFLAGALGTVITFGGATAALHSSMNQIIAGEEATLKEFWFSFKKFLARGGVLTFLGGLGFALLIFNIWFSTNYSSKIVFFLIGFWLWGIVYWYSVLQFVFPFLTQQDIKPILAIKRAGLISLDNVLASFVILVLSTAVIILSIILGAPLIIFTASFLALLQNLALRGIMVKYEQEAGTVEEGE